jgi:asparagine synthase (glutamine-hydrolysing)
MEYTYKLPDEYLISNGNKKRILKDTFKHLLPDNFFNSPKSGFEVPVGEWFRGELKEDLIATLADNETRQTGLFNTNYIQKLVNDHISYKADNARQLWTLFCFQKWYKHHMS